MLKLPKDVVSDPRHDSVLNLLTQDARPLWEGGHHPVVTLPLSSALALELRRDLAFGLACQGLELIGQTLAREQHGLDALEKKTPQGQQSARISRFLFMSNDGSTRFYRECDSLLSRYPNRLFGCRVDVTGEAMAQALGCAKLVRAVLVMDKKACARALLGLVSPV